jgi:molecular chaperone IbpA|tara:strand:- start:1653 stop:2123 length:471 start_codon:yes stop_codon:yes gene_type:complete
MRTQDFSPLLRATIGFDRMMNLLDSNQRLEEVPTYPPYNIEKTGKDAYRISMAVAGFSEDELTLTAQEDTLKVEGKKAKDDDQDSSTFLHRGIATRTFQRSFQLADHIKVVGAGLENGLLHVDLVRELPETKKPRTIAIDTTGKSQTKVIENQAAA